MPTDTLVHWGGASIKWTPQGYELKVQASVFGPRAAGILQRELDASRTDFDTHWYVSSGEIERTGIGSTAHFSLVALRHPNLLGLDPDEIRSTVNEAAATAVKEAEEAEARDNQLASDFLGKLRGD